MSVSNCITEVQSKDAARARIKAQTDEFLRSGGEIKRLEIESRLAKPFFNNSVAAETKKRYYPHVSKLRAFLKSAYPRYFMSCNLPGKSTIRSIVKEMQPELKQLGFRLNDKTVSDHLSKVIKEHYS